ncbi:PDZ domain-containing protein [Pseudooceanicola sp. GBMRC 2024]|uniref:PDZ domain-containing protein n=2 Tax=Pseudooceanicola albus TaxID=2692189 RepID=A0A6L7G032_9RHOB|nr:MULTISPECIES: trypsin-like peptidase domain-containing protein [Pseudooceanicola]MXN17299.1 PDZ domain-containing protein [Pseudooceanicola albus]
MAETKVPQSEAEISLGFAPVVKKATPAVVNIYAKRIVQTRSSPFASDPFFSQFFNSVGPSRPEVQNSLGSGVILTSDGYVVSNYHVVGEADEIRVVLSDRREFKAKVLLADKQADLAILKLDGAKDLAHLDLRDSDSVEVGDLALAIGNPFGVGQTVSSGIVSGLARSGTATGNERGYFIQTDAPINPGNSGGALIDITGKLIGVNTSILTRSGGSNGIGFAIPAAMVKQFLSEAQAGKTHYERPWAGLSGQPVDADMAQAVGLDRPQGMVISAIDTASPFAAAGFKAGDVVLAVDGVPVSGPAEVLYRMSITGLGQTARITRLRDGQQKDIDVQMVAAPEEPARNPVTTGKGSTLPGLNLITVNPAVVAEKQLPLSTQGAMIADPGSLGTRAGLQEGDVILSVNGRDTVTSEDAEDALSNPPGHYLELVLLRQGRTLNLRYRL